MEETALDVLTVGPVSCERELSGVVDLLEAYTTDDGTRYLDYEPKVSADVLVPEDLAVTILITSRVSSRAFKSVQDRGATVNLSALPEIPLEWSTENDRAAVADLLSTVACWPGFACSVASKVLHKKRPALIPILDNQAIFGAYLNPQWPEMPSRTESVYARGPIRSALDAIYGDLVRQDNRETWSRLATLRPDRTRIQLFDMVWWNYFRQIEPVAVARNVRIDP
jgi:hypothetical protein